jgi:hypothetical protein
MDNETLLEILVDIKAELAAMRSLLLVAEVPTLVQEGSLEDQQIERESLRNALLLKYPSLALASEKSQDSTLP